MVQNDNIQIGIHDILQWRMSEMGTEILVKRQLIPKMTSDKIVFCEYCVNRQNHRQSSKAGSHTNKDILDYINLGSWGLSSITSCGEAS